MSRSTVIPALACLVLATACGAGGGDGDDDGDGGTTGGIDAASGPDAQTRVTVTGLAQSVQGTATAPLAGASIEAFPRAGGTALASATSAGDGAYALELETGGAPLDIYFRARSNGLLDTYLYPPRAVTADTADVTQLLVSQQTLSTLSTLGGVSYDASKGFVGLIVADAAGTPLAGATVSIAPLGAARVLYSAGGLPSGSATATDSSGTVFIANTNAGQVTVDAAMGGTAFQDVTMEARAGALTSTLLLP